jgi:small subunit ribosomal protein S17
MMADEQEPEAAQAAAAGLDEVDVEQNVPDAQADSETQTQDEAGPEAEAASEPAPDAAGEPSADGEPEPEAEQAPGDDGDQGAPAAPAAKPEPVVIVAPKERRRLKRAAKAPAARGPLSAEERQAERVALRAKNAKARRGERLKARAAKPASEVAPPEPIEHAVGRPRARQGIVVSDKAAKTITVRVDTSRRHRRYKKIVRSSKTLHAHDEHDEAHEGDLVRVVETRPLSATKRWRLLEILERAK